jgi:hypothetical protein
MKANESSFAFFSFHLLAFYFAAGVGSRRRGSVRLDDEHFPQSYYGF